MASVIVLSGLASCASQAPVEVDRPAQSSRNADDLMVVDCTLPGQVRQLGQNFTFMAARQAIKTTAFDCGLRGGEFTAYNRSNYQTALNVWLPQAEQGNPEAQTYVGEIYEKGLGTAPDYVTAAKWYEKAASQGSARARINLGYLYEKGLGVTKDLPRALNYYRDASGLAGDDLTFASTVEIETEARVGAVRQQVDALQRELEKSRAETNTLRKKVATYQAQIAGEKNRLNRALDDLDRTQRKLKSLESAPADQQDPDRRMRYQRELEQQQSYVVAERNQLRELEQKYQTESQRLNTELGKAEQQVRQYESQLTQSKEKTDSMAAKLAESEAQLANLKQALAEKQQTAEAAADSDQATQLESVKNKVAEQEKQLTVKNRQAENLAKQIESLQTEKNMMEVKLQENDSTENGRLNDLARQLTVATGELANQYQLIDQLKSEKGRLGAEMAKLEASRNEAMTDKSAEIQALKNAIEQEKKRYQELTEQQAADRSKVASAPPTIELIDPPLSAMRSSTLGFSLRSAVDFRDITGSAKAPGGIMSLTINDLTTMPSDAGLFQSRIQLKQRDNPVNITLVDKNGREAHLNFKIIKRSEGIADPVSPPVPKKLIEISEGINFGPFHALLIGNEAYSHFPSLNTPVDDVKAINELLRQKYNFNTTMLINADRYSVISALNELRGRLTEDDNLVIYYAGHGEIDEVNQLGQWLPVDAEENNNANWIPTRQVTEIINTMSVKHILVVADSCYSGAMTRASVAKLDTGMSSDTQLKWLKAMVDAKSRTVLSSGGVQPVLDAGAGDHSIFANAFINALRENNDVLEGQTLYRMINREVRKASERVDFDQSPLYGPIRHTGHETGDFFFVPKV